MSVEGLPARARRNGSAAPSLPDQERRLTGAALAGRAVPLSALPPLLLALGCALWRLGAPTLTWDEAWSVYLARQPAAAIVRESAHTLHPPLHYLLLHWQLPFAGLSEFADRYQSVLFGVLCVALLGRIAADLFGRRVGLLAATLLALAPLQVAWSQEVRMYVPAECFLLLTVYGLLRYTRQPTWRGAALVAAAASLTLWTLYVTVLAIGLAVLTTSLVLARARKWAPLARLALALALAALAYLPWLLQFVHGQPPRQPAVALTLREFVQLWAALMPFGVSVNVGRWALAAIPWLLLAALGGARFGGRGARLMVPVLAFGFPALLYVLSLRTTPLYPGRIEARYLLPGLPFVTLLTARGLAWLAEQWRALGAAASVAAFACVGVGLTTTLGARTYSDDVRALGAFVQVYADPADAVILNTDQDWPIDAYYLNRASQPAGLPYGQRMDDAQAASWLPRLVGSAQTVWLIQSPDASQTDPTGAVRRWLAARYSLAADLPYGQTHLLVYSRQSLAEIYDVNQAINPTLFRPIDKSVASLQLLGVRPLPPVWHAGQTMFLDALWRSHAAPGPDQLSAVLVDAKTGKTVLKAAPSNLRGRTLGQMTGDDEVLTEFALPVSAALPKDPLQLHLLIGQPAKPVDTVNVGAVRVLGSGAQASSAPPAPRETLNVNLGGVIALDGADAPMDQAQPGQRLSLTLYWRALALIPQSYTVFVHLAAADERIVTQVDRLPDAGAAPTNTWAPGQRIVDQYQLTIPPGTPPGAYRLLVGLYDQATGRRLPTTSGPPDRLSANRVLVSTITVGRGQAGD